MRRLGEAKALERLGWQWSCMRIGPRHSDLASKYQRGHVGRTFSRGRYLAIRELPTRFGEAPETRLEHAGIEPWPHDGRGAEFELDRLSGLALRRAQHCLHPIWRRFLQQGRHL